MKTSKRIFQILPILLFFFSASAKASGSWEKIPSLCAPSGRSHHAAVWTGSEMIVWGGTDGATYFPDGARYNPLAHSWSPISPIGAPSAREFPCAVWTGSEMIVWGGDFNGTSFFQDG